MILAGFRWALPVLLLTVASAGCHSQSHHNSETNDAKAADWQILFDGESLSGWRGYHDLSTPQGWRVDNGMLHFSSGRGDLVTVDAYAEFELTVEWKISEGGNSGIFYLAALGSDQIYMSAPEMQVLDDARHPDGGNPLTSAGANYGLHPAPRGVVRPAGEWNQVSTLR